MASLERIKELLRRFNPQASESDLEALARALEGTSPASRGNQQAQNEEELKRRKEFLESIGETNRAREEELDFIERQIAATQRQIEREIEMAGARRDNAQAQQDLNQQTNENADAQQNQNNQTQNASKANEDLAKQLNDLRKKKILLKLEMQESASSMDYLSGVVGNASKEFAGLGDAMVTTQGVAKGLFDTFKTATGGGGMALLDSLVSNQGIQRLMAQHDILNVIVGDIERAFEVASHLDTANMKLYQTMGITEKTMKNYSFELANIANETESLLMKSPELENAAVALQESYKGFTGTEADFPMIKQLALLEKAGIQARDAAEIFAFYKQGNEDMASQADTINLKLLHTARELKRPPSEIAAAFKQGLKSIGAYGKNFQGTMSKMVAIAQKLNMEISDLTGTFDNLDTIEGAAKVAGDINNLLGKSVLNPVALARMELPDKIVEIQKAISEFDLKQPQGRFMIKQLAEVLGISGDSIVKMQGLTGDVLAQAAKEVADTGKLTDEKLMEFQGNLDKQNAAAMDVSTRQAKMLDKQMKITPGTAQEARESAASLLGSPAFRMGVGGLVSAVGLLPLILRAKGMGAVGSAAAGAGASAALQGAALGAMDDSMVDKDEQKVVVTGFYNDALYALRGIIPAGGIGGGAGFGGTIPVTDDMIIGEDGEGGAGGMGGFGPNKFGKNLATGAAVASSLGGLKDLGDFVGLTGEAGRKEDLGGAIGTALLGGIGAVFGGPVGFAIGAQIGNSLGGAVGGYFDQGAARQAAQGKQQTANLMGPDDFTVADFKTGVNANMSDEIVGVKEGGLLAKKLDRLISIMSGQNQGAGGDVVIQLDGREVGRAAVKSINNDFYNMRD